MGMCGSRDSVASSTTSEPPQSHVFVGNDSEIVPEKAEDEINTSDVNPPPLPPPEIVIPCMNVIHLDALRSCDQFPCYGSRSEIVTSLPSLNLEQSFIVYISHCWIRPANTNALAHPDTSSHEKFKLTIDGLNRISTHLLKRDVELYVYIDYCCTEISSSSSSEDDNTEKVANEFIDRIKFCDCLFTPITDSAMLPYGSNDIYADYDCKSWNDAYTGYINRAWCRLEILVSKSMVLNPARDSLEITKHALKSAVRNSQRPHFVFGYRESFANSLPVLTQPTDRPKDSTKGFVDKYNPLDGSVSRTEDKNIISLVLHKLVLLKNGKW